MPSRTSSGLVIAVLALGVLAGIAVPRVAAATNRFVAPGGIDAGVCTNPAAPCKTIGFALSVAAAGDMISVAAGVYPETNLTAPVSVTIAGAGAGATIVDGTNTARVFLVNGGISVTLSGMTIRNGKAPSGGVGGGILNNGTLTLTNVAVSSNMVPGAGGLGGGIYNGNAATLTNVTLSGNTVASSGSGGGIYNGGTVTLANVSLSSNSAPAGGGGGGIYNNNTAMLSNISLNGNSADSAGGGGINNQGTATLTNGSLIGNSVAGNGGGIANFNSATLANVTMNGNTAGGLGGGIANFGTAMLTNLTLNTNTAGGGGGGITNFVTLKLQSSVFATSACLGAITSLGGNVSDDATCFSTSGTDLASTNPQLGPLANNGGPIVGATGATTVLQTHALLAGSPAINHVPAGACPPPATDERGLPRPQGPACDSGAFEVGVVVGPTKTCVPVSPIAGSSTVCTITLTSALLNGDSVTDTVTAPLGAALTACSNPTGGLSCSLPTAGPNNSVSATCSAAGGCATLPLTFQVTVSSPAAGALAETLAVPPAGGGTAQNFSLSGQATFVAFALAESCTPVNPVVGASTLCTLTLTAALTAGDSMQVAVTGPAGGAASCSAPPPTGGLGCTQIGGSVQVTCTPVAPVATCPSGATVSLTITATSPGPLQETLTLTSGGMARPPVVLAPLPPVTFVGVSGLTGTQATKNCTGTGVAGSVLTCQITSGNSPIPPGGSVQVTSQAGWTITACTNTFNNAPVAAILASVSGTNVCVFQNTSAVAIPANSALGTEVQTIPTGAPVGTLVAQVASTCVNATVPCTIVAGSTAGAPVPVTGVTAVVAGAATNKQPTSVTLAAFLGSQTGTPLTLTSEASPSDLSATADLAGGSTTVKADALSLTGVNFISGTVTCPGGAPCADGTFQVSIVQTAIAPATAILGCDGAAVAPAGGNPCQIVNNGQQVNVNCGTTAGLQPPAAAASATCTTFWFTVQSTIGSCLGNPLPIPVGGCNTLGNLGAGNSVTIQITFLATTGNGGQTGGLNILPGATLIFGAPGVSALVVSASPYSIPSNGTLASVITATFSCTGPLATQNNFLAPGTTLNQALAGTVLGGFLANPQACNPGLPGTFNFSSLGPVIFDNGRQNESVSCGPPGSLNTFGVGAIAGFGTNNLTPPLAFTCTGAAVLAIGAGAAGDAPINVTFTSAVGGVNAIGSTLLSVVPSGAPVIGIACNPSTVAAGGLGSICIATVTDINRIPLSGLTGATVTFTVSDPTQATIIPCLVNIPSATINVTTSPNILPQLLPGGPCATPSAGIPGQVNTFVNGQASAVLVPSPTAHPGPVTVTATIGILVPPSFACISAPYATGIPGVGQPVVQNVPALGNPGLYGCGSASPFGTLGGFSGLATGLSQASFGYTGIVTMPNATSASTVVQIGGQFGILIAGSSPTQPLALSRGCNQIIVTAASATPIANIAALVSPQSAVVSIWRFNNATKQFQAGFFSDPAAPTDFVATGGQATAVSGGGNQLTNNGQQITETYFICVNQNASIVSG